MLFDFEQMTPMQCFEFLTGTVVPRPIALITSLSPTGLVNAAPYSFFNIMGIEPPVVACTVLPKPDGGLKDTGRNILSAREFVVNLVSEQMAEAMNVTCIDAPADVEELPLAGLKTVASSKIRTPSIAGSPVAFECVLRRRSPQHQPVHRDRAHRAGACRGRVRRRCFQAGLRHARLEADRRHACCQVVFPDL
jgi:flavin reductase (DIM6/NTAB) family NADH-FMN oxidoreductase RutF